MIVVGGGYGGATAAKYVRLLSAQRIDVTLVEPDPAFISCPLSNLVLGGSKAMADITLPYDTLERTHGVRRIRDRVERIEAEARIAVLASGARLPYDKLVLSPGVEMMWDGVAGLRAANEQGRILQAWKAAPRPPRCAASSRRCVTAGPSRSRSRRRPTDARPAPTSARPWSRATSKRPSHVEVLILDANPDVTSKGALFSASGPSRTPASSSTGRTQATAVDAAAGLIKFEVQDDVRADVLNVLPPMRAGAIAVQSGLANANGRWCQVNFLNFESTAMRHVHVLGDAIQIAPAMPKSGHMANGHAKVAAAAIVAELSGWDIDPAPMLTNTCYSFVDAQKAIHVASVHEYVAAERTFKTVAGSGGLSSAPNELEGSYGLNWARTIWADALA